MKTSPKQLVLIGSLFLGCGMAWVASAEPVHSANAVKCELGQECNLPNGITETLYYHVTPQGKLEHKYQCIVTPAEGNKLTLNFHASKEMSFTSQTISSSGQTTVNIPDATFTKPDQVIGEIDVTNILGGDGKINCHEE